MRFFTCSKCWARGNSFPHCEETFPFISVKHTLCCKEGCVCLQMLLTEENYISIFLEWKWKNSKNKLSPREERKKVNKAKAFLIPFQI